MKKIVSIVLSFTLLFTLFGCSNSKYTKFSKSFLNLFDTASSITAYDTSQAEFNKKYNKLYGVIKGYSELYDIYNDYDNIVNEVSRLLDDEVYYDKMSKAVNPYGDGRSCRRIVKELSME